MTSSSEEDASGGLEGLGARSESVTYPRFFLVGMTSSSADSPSSLTGAGAGAGDASGTRARSADASSFDHLGGASGKAKRECLGRRGRQSRVYCLARQLT